VKNFSLYFEFIIIRYKVTCDVCQACLKVNPDTVVYPNLISLEVSEADVLIRAADEQASRVRSSDAAAGDKIKPEVMLLFQGAYKFGKMKFPEFSRPSKQLLPDNYREKTSCNDLT